ncbi:hypothetical protein G7Y89_g8804 [Cudoniella acicularis]|uniref:Uncharacterized protein n=1 Tax=Cudoniella acicularis TaxID=354080 RepID=A0A8H4RGV3_9HELO|nr:hypothetical protein G7Y89_g8804 [Cudoniella acicularis]
MDCHSLGIYFHGEVVPSPRPTANMPGTLRNEAILALPFISSLVGVDELCPTKAVYALYDSSAASLRFVHGNGTFVTPEQICFLKLFQGDPLNRAQRDYYLELRDRSIMHNTRLYSLDMNYISQLENLFPTLASVTGTLLFMSDVKASRGRCPALMAVAPKPGSLDHASSPPVHINVDSKWNFDTRGFRAQISQEHARFLDDKAAEFRRKYNSRIDDMTFRHAAFCLVGLKRADLINFVYVGDNDKKYFVPNITPPRTPKLKVPLETALGWTVDCFIARFWKFEKEFVDNDDYVRVPNPILWLEAQLQDEAYRHEMNTGFVVTKPWRGKVSIEKEAESIPAVLDWNTLMNLEWVRNDAARYPRLFVFSKPAQQLQLSDIINPKTNRFKESKKAKRDRKEKEKAAKKARTTAVDLTNDSDDDVPRGHMNRRWDLNLSDDFASGYAGDESEAGTTKSRKRNHSPDEDSPQQLRQSPKTRSPVDPESNGGSLNYQTFIKQHKAKIRLQEKEANKQKTAYEPALLFVKEEKEDEDIYDDSDREITRQRRKCQRSPSLPMAEFKTYPDLEEFTGLTRTSSNSSQAHLYSKSPSSSKFPAFDKFDRALQLEGKQDSAPSTPKKAVHPGSSLISPPPTSKINSYKWDETLTKPDLSSEDKIELISNPALTPPPHLRKKEITPVVPIPKTPTRTSSSSFRNNRSLFQRACSTLESQHHLHPSRSPSPRTPLDRLLLSLTKKKKSPLR